MVRRIVCAYEAGRDGFWLARWLQAHAIEAYVIHAASIAVSREHRRAKSDRIDTELLMRSFLGWLRGEKRHCSMVAIPTMAQEDARRPSRERENLVGEQTRIVNRVKAVLALFGIGGLNPRLRSNSRRWAPWKEPRYRKTPARSCAAIWSGCAWCATRSVPSKASVWAGSRLRRVRRRVPTRWFV